MKLFIKEALLFLGVLSISGTATYYYCSSNSSNGAAQTPDVEKPRTPAQIMTQSMSSLQKFSVDAKLDFMYLEDMTHGFVSVNGNADITDMDNIKVEGTLASEYGASHVDGKLAYIDNNVYLTYNKNYFKLMNSDITSFIDTLPSLGINISVPEEFKNLDLGALLGEVENLEPIEAPDGYMFQYDLNSDMSIFFKTDYKYNFTGIRTNTIFYGDLKFDLYADIISTGMENLVITNPESAENAPTYVNFRPALTLFEGFYKTFSAKTNTLGFKADIKHTDAASGTTSDFLGLAGDISYDFGDHPAATVDLNITEHSRTHELGVYYQDGTIFLNQANINKVSIGGRTIHDVIDYLTQQISDEQLKQLLDKLSTSMNSVDISAILSNLNSLNKWITNVETVDNKITITLDLSTFDKSLGIVKVSCSQNQEKLLGFALEGLSVSGYTINVSLNVKPTNLVRPVAAEYVELDPAVNLVPTIFQLINQEKFRIELKGKVTSTTQGVTDVNFNGGFQFDVLKKYGYGEADIIDRDGFDHNIKADYRTDNLLLFSYNDTLNGKMTGASIMDLVNLVKKVAAEPSEHFYELFGDLLKVMGETPLGQALKGDIGILFATKTFSNIKVTETTIDMDLSGALVNLDQNLHLTINYDEDTLYSLKISDVHLNTDVIEVEIFLKGFKPELDAQNSPARLDPFKCTMDFSDLALLAELGINTSMFNDFHFTGNALIKILLSEIQIPLDIRIKNNKGSVAIAVEIPEVPVIAAVTANKTYWGTDSRSASVYYENNTVYIHRVDKVKKKLVTKERWWAHYEAVCDLQNFMDNILSYLLDTTLGLQPWILDQITGSINKAPGKQQILYQNVLRDFANNKTEDYFLIDIDLAEIAHNKNLNAFTIKIHYNELEKQLTGIDATLVVSVGISIDVGASLQLVNLGQEVNLDAMNSYVATHNSDVRNTVQHSEVRV